MTKLTKSEVVQRLQAAAEDEHAAIIQYLRHAYGMGETPLACEIEGIARDEMRHFWMLSRWMVRLSGQPTIQRGFTDLAGANPPEWLLRDVSAEERAIAMYQGLIAADIDPDLRADLERILADEQRHHDEFAGFVTVAQAELNTPTPDPQEPPSSPLPTADREALAWGVSHEYAAILQYLAHSFVIQDEEVSRQLELQAINEMQHMGWFGEELLEKGAEMPLDHHSVSHPPTVAAMLEADIALENETSAAYARFLSAMSNPGAKDVMAEARGHEQYHADLFTRLLARIRRAAAGNWTVGSLKNS